MPSSKSRERREERDKRRDDRPSQSRQSSGRSRSNTERDDKDTRDGPEQDYRRQDDRPSGAKMKKYKYVDSDDERKDRSLPQSSMPMSSIMSATGQQAHLPDQFPGQMPDEYSLPFRPPMSTTESFGEASAYYGDQGESVQHQPGVRPGTPIVANTQLHLQPASAMPNPVQDTGNGSAADFYGVSNTASVGDERYPAPHPTILPGIPGVPTATPIPAIPVQPPAYTSSASTLVPDKGQPSRPPRYDRPTISHHASSHVGPLVLGAAGLAAAQYAHQQHHSQQTASDGHGYHSSSHATSSNSNRPHSPKSPSHRPDHSPPRSARRRGPLSRLADWWNDQEDVRKMEEYTEYIGVCRGCFDPHSSPGDAPRRHHHHKRNIRGEDRHRIDKDRRYYSSSSDSESSRRRRSARRRHSPRLERRSSDQRSSTSYGVIEIERDTSRKGGSEHDRGGRFVRTEQSEFIEVDSSRRAERRNDNDRGRESQATGFFASFFSPSSTQDRSTRRYEIDSGESDNERRSVKRKREKERHRPTTSSAAEALTGLGVAAASLAAVNRREYQHHASNAELLKRDHQHHRTSSHRRYSAGEESWESASDSGSAFSLDSALAYGGEDYERPRKRRGSHGSVSSGRSGYGNGDWRSRRRENGRRRPNRTSRHNEEVEVIFDREELDERRETRERRDKTNRGDPERPLQLVDPQPWSPGTSQVSEVPIHSPQPISPPKTFANFEDSQSRQIDQPVMQHTQSAPAGSFQAQYSGNPETDIIVSRVEVDNVRDISKRESSHRQNVSIQDAVYEATGMTLAGAVAGVLAKSPRIRERKASVRFANVESDGEDHITAQHHSRTGSHDLEEMPDNTVTEARPSMPRVSSVRSSKDDGAGIGQPSRSKMQEHVTVSDVRPGNEYRGYVDPILDDDLNDPNFFKRSREKTRAEDANQDQQVSDMFADLEDRYSKENAIQSQADFFRPEDLGSSSRVLDRRVDAVVRDFSDVDRHPDMPRQSSVPVLRVIAATPPPDLAAKPKARTKETRASPLSATVESGSEPEEASRTKPSRVPEDTTSRDAAKTSMSRPSPVNGHEVDNIDEEVERNTPGGFVVETEDSYMPISRSRAEDYDREGPARVEDTGEGQHNEDTMDQETPSKVRTLRRRSSKNF